MKILTLSLAAVLYAALGHTAPQTKHEDLQLDPESTYEIRYTPPGTDKIAIVTVTSLGEVMMLGTREVISCVTTEGETYCIPVDLILDIRELKQKKPLTAATPTPTKK